MEEEISLREIIDTLWKGKWLIIGITVAALLISIVYSFFIADPIYKGSAKVTVHNVASVPEAIQPYINEMTQPELFEQTMKSTSVLEKTIQIEKLDFTIAQLQSEIKVELPVEESSPFISISMEGADKEEIKSIIDNVINLTRAELETNIHSRLSLLEEEYRLKMDEEDQEINQAIDEFNEIGAGEGLPTLILFQENIADSQYILEANEELLNQLRDLQKEDQVQYEKINKKIENLTSLYNFYSNKYDEVRSISTMNIIDLSTNVLSDTFVPDQQISPNKTLNLAIAVVLGLMVGIGVVFVRSYIKDEYLSN